VEVEMSDVGLMLQWTRIFGDFTKVMLPEWLDERVFLIVFGLGLVAVLVPIAVIWFRGEGAESAMQDK
jgi:hypothetical protein